MFWKRPCLEGLWPFLDSRDVLDTRTTASSWNLPSKYAPYRELFFFPYEKGIECRVRNVPFAKYDCAETFEDSVFEKLVVVGVVFFGGMRTGRTCVRKGGGLWLLVTGNAWL